MFCNACGYFLVGCDLSVEDLVLHVMQGPRDSGRTTEVSIVCTVLDKETKQPISSVLVRSNPPHLNFNASHMHIENVSVVCDDGPPVGMGGVLPGLGSVRGGKIVVTVCNANNMIHNINIDFRQASKNITLIIPPKTIDSVSRVGVVHRNWCYDFRVFFARSLFYLYSILASACLAHAGVSYVFDRWVSDYRSYELVDSICGVVGPVLGFMSKVWGWCVYPVVLLCPLFALQLSSIRGKIDSDQPRRFSNVHALCYVWDFCKNKIRDCKIALGIVSDDLKLKTATASTGRGIFIGCNDPLTLYNIMLSLNRMLSRFDGGYGGKDLLRMLLYMPAAFRPIVFCGSEDNVLISRQELISARGKIMHCLQNLCYSYSFPTVHSGVGCGVGAINNTLPSRDMSYNRSEVVNISAEASDIELLFKAYPSGDSNIYNMANTFVSCSREIADCKRSYLMSDREVAIGG